MPVTEFDFKEKYRYQNGFDSYFEQVHLLMTCCRLWSSVHCFTR